MGYLNILVAGLLVVGCADARTRPSKTEDWGYVTVRPNANMFWWLYNYQGINANAPLILWLQGGPGASGVGYGNFEEIGPLDVNLQPRNTTWLKAANLLFIDNPVGTGYSYVTDDSAYTTSVDQIGADLVTLFKQLFTAKPELQSLPFYVFSESYGGKMTAVFAVHLWKAIQSGDINCKFQGIAMGDSWVHPELIVNSWSEYLYSTSLIDGPGKVTVDQSAAQVSAAIAAGDWNGATNAWGDTEGVVGDVTGGVDWYNILYPFGSEKGIKSSRKTVKLSRKLRPYQLKMLYRRHLAVTQDDNLDALMNGPIRTKLGIIPANVTWGGQSANVFAAQSVEFMKPVVDSVDFLLNKTSLQVVVYNGQLDLICDSIGVEAWVQTLKWPGLPSWNSANRAELTLPDTGATVGFVKNYQAFYFYWMLRAGHMLPSDQGAAALYMVNTIIGGQ